MIFLPSLLPFGGLSKIAPNFLHLKCAHIPFWLNPTGHSKFHNPVTPSAYYRHRSDCSYSLVPASAGRRSSSALPNFVSCPGKRCRRRPVSVSVTGVRYNSLFWMCTLNSLIWPDMKLVSVYTILNIIFLCVSIPWLCAVIQDHVLSL